ncbi:unnamed protein product, partial [Meganyctiphanes norvegica]
PVYTADMTRFALTLLVAVAVVGVVTEALPSWPPGGPPPPTPSCQRWCPRPGQLGQYDCCEDGQSCPVVGPFGCAPADGGTCRSSCHFGEYEVPFGACGHCKCCK